MAKLLAFLRSTQPEAVAQLGLEDEAKRLKFLHRLQGEVAKRGVIDVLRSGVKDGPVSVELFFGTPSAVNAKAVELHVANIFSITRQLRYAKDGGALSLDMANADKAAMIAAIQVRGFRPSDDNEADAIALLLWATDTTGGRA